ncbi:hypothetical protein ACQP04_31225 [Pseudonocardia halophobica]|uniref:hypothetical protein n=1 Tax=Pseudonocardia halophobica TaxID=29401 RepID=UPI003D8E21FC
MGTLRMAAVSAPFGRDLVEGFARVTALVAEARAGGEILAWTGQREGLATAALDAEAAVDAARAGMNFLRDRRPDTYAAPDGTPSEAA